MTDCPYDELDPPVVGLCRVLNAIPGIRTVSSCGGHGTPGPCGNPADRWDVWLKLELDADRRPTRDAWHNAEFVIWALGKDMGLNIKAHSPVPVETMEGTWLGFDIEGHRTGSNPREPDDAARFLLKLMEDDPWS